MRVSALLLSSVILIPLVAQSPSAQAAPRVDLELITDSGFPITGAQSWVQAMRNVGADSVRIRGAKSGEVGEIKNVGTERSPNYRVTGILSARNTLRVPGGEFRMNDISGIKNWISKLKSGGLEGLFAKTGAFGLTSTQLLEVHDKLSGKVEFSTKGKKAREVAGQIVNSLQIKVAVDQSARRPLATDETIPEEMMGLTSGTVLAAALRPLGLVMTLRKPTSGEVHLIITDARNVKEIWPIGWPLEKPPGEAMPKLYEFLNVEIDDFVLQDALDAIQKRLETPFLYDRNAMARHGAEPANVKVTLPKGRSYYKKIIDRLLAKSKPQMRSDLRVDESGQPFLWITTMKR